MVVFPNCKINIGLQIKDKRPDGFHNLETIFVPLAIKDALEILPAADGQLSNIEYTSSGNTIDGNLSDNLCIKAIELVRKDHPRLPSLRLHLHKNIPSGAGLGGGSADAAFTLQLINRLFDLHITEQSMAEYALQLGSDCPFFLKNKPIFATGRGELLEDVQLDLSAYRVLLINPGIHVNTGWAFSQLQVPGQGHTDLKAAINQPLSEWKQIIKNDFEIPVFTAHPEIATIKNTLYENGALYAAMSGSGSSVFAIFDKEKVPVLNFPPHYFCKLV